MKRVITKIGDLFSVEIDENQVRFFQYIANDLTQLNSSVIRVFKNIFSKEEILSWNEVANGEVDFYAHVFLRNGLKMGHWQKVGHSSEIGLCDVLFRNSNDYGNPKIRNSQDWHVWKISQPFVKLGKLEAKYDKTEIGIVVTPADIVHRIKTGKFNFVYPSF